MNESVSQSVESDRDYAQFEQLVAQRVQNAKGPLFTTDADPDKLWRAYLDGLPADNRQHYNCNSCRRFIQRYGGLVTLDSAGNVSTSMIWGVDVPGFFLPSVVACGNLLAKAKITGIFLSPEETWGTPFNNPHTPSKFQGKCWTHLHGRNPNVFKHPTLSAEQKMAELREDYGVLCRSLAEYRMPVAEQAVRILSGETLCRSEKAEGGVSWFLGVHSMIEGVKGPRRQNLIWSAVAHAPPGFCHLKNNVAATLMDDIASGLAIETVQKRWAQKLHPLQYQRPTAAPSDGQIAAAEKLVERLGLAPSFERRFARLDEVQKWLWKPGEELKQEMQGGFFGHLKTKKQPKTVELPSVTITWEKFQRTVLPSALSVECEISPVGNYYGLTTAVHPDAPPILQWDGLDWNPRNPVSQYVYHNGSFAGNWHLSPGNAKVTCIFEHPSRWQEPSKFQHHGKGIYFALEGAWDAGGDSHGLALFPETLKAELQGIRSVIEAHSKKGGIQGKEQGTANGIVGPPVTLRVRTAEGYATYFIDRMD